MPRTARIVLAGFPHHITQRGNRRENVFFTSADRVAYLDWLREHCEANQVQILAYCLMDNHVHIVAVPSEADGLEKTFRPLHTRYAMRVNRKRNSSGHVWQGRYFSSVLHESYLWATIRYVERNPVRGSMVATATEYPWSSAAAHCGLRRDQVLTRRPEWVDEMKGVMDWPGWLAEDQPRGEIEQMREQFSRGWPYGPGDFVRKLEKRFGCRLSPRQRGRPPKTQGTQK